MLRSAMLSFFFFSSRHLLHSPRGSSLSSSLSVCLCAHMVHVCHSCPKRALGLEEQLQHTHTHTYTQWELRTCFPGLPFLTSSRRVIISSTAFSSCSHTFIAPEPFPHTHTQERYTHTHSTQTHTQRYTTQTHVYIYVCVCAA